MKRHDRLIVPPKMASKSGASQWDRHAAKNLLKKGHFSKET